jgi:hypothetical protein
VNLHAFAASRLIRFQAPAAAETSEMATATLNRGVNAACVLRRSGAGMTMGRSYSDVPLYELARPSWRAFCIADNRQRRADITLISR